MPRNLALGIAYLQAAMPQAPRQAAVCMASHLQLRELLAHGLLDVLEIAAQHEDVGRLKLAAWHLIRGELKEGVAWLQRCASALARNLGTCAEGQSLGGLLQALQALRAITPADVADAVAHEARAAMEQGRSQQAVRMLETLADLPHVAPDAVLQQLICDAVHQAQVCGHGLGRLEAAWIEAALDRSATGGDLQACHTLGRALAGLPCGHLAPQRLVGTQNLRKAAALLLRAADGGVSIAWLHLFRICSDYRSSVANPALARFCLEKAAGQGMAEAQRRLGALVLRDAVRIESMEQGMGLLHAAAAKGDTQASLLLHSLVLPVQGSDEEAWSAIDEVQHAAPLLAMRLRLARSFGLTKLEALSVNPSAAMRPWGMVVGRNPFLAKARLCEPRAVPAVSPQAHECLQLAATMFSDERQQSIVLEGSLRVRTLQMRRLFQRLQLHEKVFFACASSHEREVLRVGTKWARRQRDILQQVLG